MGDRARADEGPDAGTDHVLPTCHELLVNHLASKVLSGLSGTKKQSRKSTKQLSYAYEQAFHDRLTVI
jgi:hypothetical protein